MRDNCYNHTETVDQRLASFGFTPELPLYVAADWADVDVDREQEVGQGGGPACTTAQGLRFAPVVRAYGVGSWRGGLRT